MSHISSDQRRTSSVFAVQRNGMLILQASRHRRGFAVWMARLLALGVAAALVTGCGTSSTPPPSQQPPSQGAQNCAWPSMVNVQSANYAFPDSAAAYWGQPIVADQHTTIQIAGQFPDARYAALSVYTPYGNPFTTNGVSSSLPDYRIQPQSGSQNPWQQPAPPDGRFDVTIRSDVTPAQVNALPMPAGTSSQHPGYLVYRVYLPAGSTFSHVPLPTLTIAEGNTARPLPTCSTHNTPVPVPPEQAPSPTPPSGAPTTVPPFQV